MSLILKKDKLVNFIKDQLSVFLKSDFELMPSWDVGILEEPACTVFVGASDLYSFKIGVSEAERIFKKMLEEQLVIGFEPINSTQVDKNFNDAEYEEFEGFKIFISKRQARNFGKAVDSNIFRFNPSNGIASFKNKTTKFRPGSNQYKFMCLLEPEPGRIFRLSEIAEKLGLRYSDNSTLVKRTINDLVRDIRKKIRDELGYRKKIFVNNGGYGLIE